MTNNNINPWPYSYVMKLAEEATIEAQRQGLRPALAAEVVKTWRQSKRFNIPFLGNYIPEGWVLVPGSEVYVSTVKGNTSTTTLTQFEFFQIAKQHTEMADTYGFGVMEQAQIKVLIATYRKEEA